MLCLISNLLYCISLFFISCWWQIKTLLRNFGGPWQGSCYWTKQCIHLRMHENFIYGCWKTIKELWKIWATFMFLNQTTYSLWRGVKMSNGCWISRNFERPIQGSCSLTKQCNLFQHVCICEKDVAKLSRNFEEPWNLNVLQLNNGFIFKMHGNVQKMSKDYQGTLKDISKTHVLEPNDACTLNMHGNIKDVLKNY